LLRDRASQQFLEVVRPDYTQHCNGPPKLNAGSSRFYGNAQSRSESSAENLTSVFISRCQLTATFWLPSSGLTAERAV